MRVRVHDEEKAGRDYYAIRRHRHQVVVRRLIRNSSCFCIEIMTELVLCSYGRCNSHWIRSTCVSCHVNFKPIRTPSISHSGRPGVRPRHAVRKEKSRPAQQQVRVKAWRALRSSLAGYTNEFELRAHVDFLYCTQNPICSCSTDVRSLHAKKNPLSLQNSFPRLSSVRIRHGAAEVRRRV